MSDDLRAQLGQLEEEGARAVQEAESAERVEALRLELIGRKGRLTGVLRGLGQLDPELRPATGFHSTR